MSACVCTYDHMCLRNSVRATTKKSDWFWYRQNQWRTFWLFLQKYQESLEKSMKYSVFVFDFVDGLHYKCHKVSLSHGRSYIYSPKLLKNKNSHSIFLGKACLDYYMEFWSWIMILHTLCQHQELYSRHGLKKTKVKLEFYWADVNKLLMVEKSIRGGMCHTIQEYGKANNKFIKDCDWSKESSYLMYWDIINLYG